jgi:hypothetical protein
VTFGSYETSKEVLVKIVDDDVSEDDVVFFVQLSVRPEPS